MKYNSLTTRIQRRAFSIVWWQAICVCIVASIGFISSHFDTRVGLSILVGGFAYCIPNLLFVWRVFRYSGAHQMNQFAAAFMAGEALKLVLSAFLFLLAVKYLPVSLLSVLIGFISAIVSFWLVCFWKFSIQERRA